MRMIKVPTLMNLERLDTTSSHTVHGLHLYLAETIRLKRIKAIVKYIIFHKTTTSRL